MFNFKRFLAAMMAVLMLALSFSVVLADDEDHAENHEVLRAYYTSGTYNGYSYSLNAVNSSSSLLWCRGDYGTDINMKLRFKFQLCYPVYGGTYALYGPAKTLNYGNYYDHYLVKSYTVGQAVSEANLSNVPTNSCFKECTYSLLLNSTFVDGFLDVYIQF